MTTPNQQPARSTNTTSPATPGFEELAVHLTFADEALSGQTADNLPLPNYLNPTTQPTHVMPLKATSSESARIAPAAVTTNAVASTENVAEAVSKWQQLRSAVGKLNPLQMREPSPKRLRFNSDPRDDVRLKWADETPEWWHFDVEARMVYPETLWINEKLQELFRKYLKPVWWDRFVEGINDFLSSVYRELLRPLLLPVWTLLIEPLVKLFRDVEWPWNFELRGAHVSVKQSPFRRIVFDNRISQELVDRLWNDPDCFLEAGVSLKRDDRTTVARVPLRHPESEGHFPKAASGVLKRLNLRNLGHTLTHMLWFTRAARAWVYGREMLEAGLETPRPLAMVEDRIGPLRFRSFVLTEHVEGTHLMRYLRENQLTTTELDRIASQFAQIWHTLGELRIVHGDLKATNFLVTPHGQLKLIDLDGTFRHWFDITFLPLRDRDWLRFFKNWKGRPEVAAAFRAAVARHLDERTAAQTPVASPRVQWQRAA